MVVSYTNMFQLSWNTYDVIKSSGYQCSVWEPVLGENEYCLGYLAVQELQYPSHKFLIVIKAGNDKEAFKRPLGLECRWSTKFYDPNTAKYGGFYRPVPPQGYCSLGDVAIYKKKSEAVTIDDFPKLVCVKREYVSLLDEGISVCHMCV